ncbi:MAG: hypothetical protein WC924_03795 [Candidatus Gracilibacteria bacterium]
MKLTNLLLLGELALAGCPQDPEGNHIFVGRDDTDSADTSNPDSDSDSNGSCDMTLTPGEDGESVTWRVEGDSGSSVQVITSWYGGLVKRISDVDGDEKSGIVDWFPHEMEGHSIQEAIVANGGVLETNVEVKVISPDGETLCQAAVDMPFATNLVMPAGMALPTHISFEPEFAELMGTSFDDHFGLQIIKPMDQTDSTAWVVVVDLVTRDVLEMYILTDAESQIASAHFWNGRLVVMSNAYPNIVPSELLTYDRAYKEGDAPLTHYSTEGSGYNYHHRFFLQENGERLQLNGLDWSNPGALLEEENGKSIVADLDPKTWQLSNASTIFEGTDILSNEANYFNSTSLSPTGSDGTHFRVDTCSPVVSQDAYFVAINEDDEVSLIFRRENHGTGFNDDDIRVKFPSAILVDLPDGPNGEPPIDFIHDAQVRKKSQDEEGDNYMVTVFNLVVTTAKYGYTRIDTYDLRVPFSGEPTVTQISASILPEDGRSNGSVASTDGTAITGAMLGYDNGSTYWVNSGTGDVIGEATSPEQTTYYYLLLETDPWARAGFEGTTQTYDMEGIVDLLN